MSCVAISGSGGGAARGVEAAGGALAVCTVAAADGRGSRWPPRQRRRLPERLQTSPRRRLLRLAEEPFDFVLAHWGVIVRHGNPFR